MIRESRTSWIFLLDWGVVALTLASAGASALAALIAFHHDDTSAMAEAVLAFVAAIGAAWLGRSASRAAKRWQEELVSWQGNDIVLLADDLGRILDANDRAVEAYGQPLDALFRQHVGSLRHPTATDGLERHLDELREQGQAVFATVHRHGDGSPFPVEVSARALSVRGKRLLHLIARDVTEAHRARARLVAAERLAAVASVAAGVAHDVNNPLCSVVGNLSYALDALGDATPDVAEIRASLSEARASALRVRDTVRELNACVDDARRAATPPPATPPPAIPPLEWSPRAGIAAAMGILSPGARPLAPSRLDAGAAAADGAEPKEPRRRPK